jgi:BTB/POZ domain
LSPPEPGSRSAPKPESAAGSSVSRILIHKDVICRYPPFFRAAFDGKFKEGDSQEMTLDVDIRIFGIFVHYIYTRSVLDANARQFRNATQTI